MKILWHTVYYFYVSNSPWRCGWFDTRLHHYKQTICVGSLEFQLLTELLGSHESKLTGESITHTRARRHTLEDFRRPLSLRISTCALIRPEGSTHFLGLMPLPQGNSPAESGICFLTSVTQISLIPASNIMLVSQFIILVVFSNRWLLEIC